MALEQVQDRIAIAMVDSVDWAALFLGAIKAGVGNTAAFLCSDLANGITGEVTYVDSGYNILGMTGIGDSD